MNAAQSPLRPITAVVVLSLMWLWLIGLSFFAALSYQTMNDQADQSLLDSRLQGLEAQVVGLAETIEAIQQRPTVATAADLKDTRERLEARAVQVETTLSGYAAAEDLQALRTEVDQIKARQSTVRAAAPAQPRTPRRPSARAGTAATAVPHCRRRASRWSTQPVRCAERRVLHARPA